MGIKANSGIWGGWWGSHGSTFNLLPIAISEHEYFVFHDECEAIEDSFYGEIAEDSLLLFEVEADVVKSWICLDAGIHAFCISSKETGTRRQDQVLEKLLEVV
eukprot:13498181-Ditylum_brightwellii.AAC.1